jgi:two-component system cell cycle sensor histidine kinase/response regulator CckA
VDNSTTGEPGANNRATILVVDDQETLLLVLSTMLQRAGYQPLTAASSQEALALFNQHAADIDLALLDLHLPAESTAELFDSLRALRPDLRVILMSGVPGQVALERLAKEGVKGFLCKPFSPSELTRTIEAVLHPSGGSATTPPGPREPTGDAILGTTWRGSSG